MEHRVEFDLTEDDYVAWAQHLRTRFVRSRRGKLEKYLLRFVGISLVPVFFAVAYVVAVSETFALLPSVMVLVIPGGFLWFLWYRRTFARRVVRRALRKPGGTHALGSRTVVVTPEGIHFRSSSGEASLKWHAVLEIEGAEQAIYFVVSAASTAIVPARAFPNRRECREFMQAAQRYHDPSDSPPRPCPKCGYDLRSVAEPGCPECGQGRGD